MILFLYGTDVRKNQKKSEVIIDTLRKKKQNASYLSFDTDCSSSAIEGALTSTGLFEENYIILIKNITQNKDLWKDASKLLKKMQQSSHVFVWVEDGKETAQTKKIQAVAQKSEEHNLKEIKKEDDAVFGFLTLFFNKNAKDAWVWYTSHPKVDVSQILNLIMWQIKSVALVVNARTPAEAGLTPYVFNTSKNILRNWTQEELAQLHVACIAWQTRARQGERNSHEFEQYILNLS